MFDSRIVALTRIQETVKRDINDFRRNPLNKENVHRLLEGQATAIKRLAGIIETLIKEQ